MGEIRFTPKIKLAVTVDDLFLWKGIPWSPGYSPSTVVPEMTAAFSRHGLKHVYGFSGTAPAGGDRGLREIFDHWSEAGHKICITEAVQLVPTPPTNRPREDAQKPDEAANALAKPMRATGITQQSSA